MAEFVVGRLLVASPELLDPNFLRTVVLILLHDENGAFGIVLNRPTTMPVDDHIPAWSEHIAAPTKIFTGGPVQPEAAIGLALGFGDPGGEGWNGMPLGLGLVDLSRDPDLVGATIERVRVFAGYSGWGAGQLDGEIEQGGWFVVDYDESDTFTEEPATLWRRVLQRQHGKLALFAHAPLDPRVN